MDRVVTAIPALGMLARWATVVAPSMDTVETLLSTAALGVRRVMELAFKLFVGFDEFWRREA